LRTNHGNYLPPHINPQDLIDFGPVNPLTELISLPGITRLVGNVGFDGDTKVDALCQSASNHLKQMIS